jgi:hypothetical protein
LGCNNGEGRGITKQNVGGGMFCTIREVSLLPNGFEKMETSRKCIEILSRCLVINPSLGGIENLGNLR